MKTPNLLAVLGIFCFICSCEKSDIRQQQSSLQTSSSKNDIVSIKKKALSVGDYYGGGIIFSIDAAGEHGSIVSTKDLGTAPWGCSGVLMPGTDWAYGTGSRNTEIILSNCQEPGIAARICHDLVIRDIPSANNNGKANKEVGKKYDDWYLPSMDEMAHLLAVSYSSNDPVLNNLFPTGSYWTSCQGPLFWHNAFPLDPSLTAFARFHYDKTDYPYGQYIIPQPFGRGQLVMVRAIRSF